MDLGTQHCRPSTTEALCTYIPDGEDSNAYLSIASQSSSTLIDTYIDANQGFRPRAVSVVSIADACRSWVGGILHAHRRGASI